MSPILSMYDGPNGRAGNTIPLSNVFLRYATFGVQSANFNYLRGCEFSVRAPILSHHVNPVFRDSSREQVGGIAAGRPVARMAHKQGRPLSNCQEEGDAMGKVFAFLELDRAVPFPTLLPKASFCPTPADSLRALAGRAINVTPKAFDFLRGKLRWVYSDFSHVSLLNRLIRLGSFGCLPHSFEPSYFTTSLGRSV